MLCRFRERVLKSSYNSLLKNDKTRSGNLEMVADFLASVECDFSD